MQQATLKTTILRHCSAVALPIPLVWVLICSRVSLMMLLSQSFMLVRSGWSMPNHDLARSVQLCCSDSRRSPVKPRYQRPGQACRQRSEMASTFPGSLAGVGMLKCQALALLSCSGPDHGRTLQPVAAHTQLQGQLALFSPRDTVLPALRCCYTYDKLPEVVCICAFGPKERL